MADTTLGQEVGDVEGPDPGLADARMYSLRVKERARSTGASGLAPPLSRRAL